MGAAAAASDAFAGSLYEVLARDSETFAFSPYSIAVALAMTAAGARAETLAELERVVGTSRPPAIDDTRLEVANSLWAQEGLRIERAFLDTLAEVYDAGIELADFETHHESARDAINKWVGERTEGKIPELLGPGSISADTRLTLVNAVYLKARWALPFEPTATRTAPFHSPHGVVDAQFMHEFATFRYARGDGFEAIELPYEGGDLAMDVVLPDPGELAAVEQRMAGDGVAALLDGLAPARVALALPKLGFGSTFMLGPALRALGIELLFTDRADLSGITSDAPLLVDEVVHQSTLEVDEAGTEASAATAVVARAAGMASPDVEMSVDRPFILTVRERASGAILFLARVSDPNAG